MATVINRTQRRQKVIEYLKEHKLATIEDISRAIKDDSSVARSVLTQMLQKGLVRKSYRFALVPAFSGEKIRRQKFAVFSLVN